jgi:hypothetical protein
MTKLALLLPVATLLISCSSEPLKPTNSWAGRMQGTAHSLQGLMPYLYDEDQFTNPKNSKEIEEKIANYSKSIHNIDKKMAKVILGDDPYIKKSLDSLKELTTRSHESFKRGDRKNSRILLKATTNTCFKCHTRQNIGPEKMRWSNFDVAGLETHPIEKAHIYVSMRDYENAKKVLNEYLTDSESDRKFDLSYESALHYYLMISLRGQKTFDETLKFLTDKTLVADTPTPLHYTLKHWKKDLTYFKKNPAKMKANLPAVYQVLKRNKNRYSERNLINNLIASSLLSEYLMREPSRAKKAKAYRLLGEVYDELIVEGFWDLPEMYYEMCIDYAPKSKIAKSCYTKLKENVTVGYSGSRGTLIPTTEYQRLEKLRKKAGY